MSTMTTVPSFYLPKGQEFNSDIGYTHTRYSGWTITTCISQYCSHWSDAAECRFCDRKSHGTGQLKFYDDNDIHVKAIDLDASSAIQWLRHIAGDWVTGSPCGSKAVIILLDRFWCGRRKRSWLVPAWHVWAGRDFGNKHPAWTTCRNDGAGMGEVRKCRHHQFHKDPKRYHPYYLLLRNVRTGVASEKTVDSNLAIWGTGVGLRTYILSSKRRTGLSLRSPSIRLWGRW